MVVLSGNGSLYHRSERVFAHGVGPGSDWVVDGARVNLITKVLDFVQSSGPFRRAGDAAIQLIQRGGGISAT